MRPMRSRAEEEADGRRRVGQHKAKRRRGKAPPGTQIYVLLINYMSFIHLAIFKYGGREGKPLASLAQIY